MTRTNSIIHVHFRASDGTARSITLLEYPLKGNYPWNMADVKLLDPASTEWYQNAHQTANVISLLVPGSVRWTTKINPYLHHNYSGSKLGGPHVGKARTT